MRSEKSEGVGFAMLSFGMWGLLPLFWKFLQEVPSLQILLNRIVWAFVFYTIILFVLERKSALKWNYGWKVWLLNFLAASLVSANWFVYIEAVNTGRVLETSLGYFINPLLNILLGCWILGEKLERHHKIAALSSLIGVVIIGLQANSVPYIALFLAVTFSFYGLIRRQLKQSGLKGGQLETLLMLPLVALYLVTHSWPLLRPELSLSIGLVLAGAATALPLTFFTEAAKRLPYYLIGFFQFLAPSLMFLVGVFYKEPVSPFKLLGFAFIWAGSLILLSKAIPKRAAKTRDATHPTR